MESGRALFAAHCELNQRHEIIVGTAIAISHRERSIYVLHELSMPHSHTSPGHTLTKEDANKKKVKKI